ncbi:MAG TPA: phospholipase D family protein [Candidatus Didemnitutus sp.]|nr:phospholipase D family protein [Candidatus Didemnitutus sp.]
MSHAATFTRRLPFCCLALAGAMALAFSGCSSPNLNVPKPESHALATPEETPIGKAYAVAAKDHPGLSGFRLLPTGQEAILARIALAAKAERTLDLQYYMVHQDTSTALLFEYVIAAARRGVHVRFLIDDMYARGKDIDLGVFDSHPNIEVRVFNPFLNRGPLGLSRMFEFVADGSRLNRRMHNKLWIADNAAAIVGGRNLGDEYFGVNPGGFADLDVVAVGPVVPEISRSFDEYWNSEWAVPITAFVTQPASKEKTAELVAKQEQAFKKASDTDYAKSLRASPMIQEVTSGNVPVVWAQAEAKYDPPKKFDDKGKLPNDKLLLSQLSPLLQSAKTELDFISPYFIPGEGGVKWLTDAKARGVRIQVLTNSLDSTDVSAVSAGYSKYREDLLKGGVELYEMKRDPQRADSSRGSSAGSLHAKAFIADRQSVFIGSMNLDPRSHTTNTEVGLVIHSPELADQLGKLFAEGTAPIASYQPKLDAKGEVEWHEEKDGKPIVHTTEPAPWTRRFSKWLMSIFAPESML